MTSKTLVILAGAAALIGVGAYVAFNSRAGGVGSTLSGGTALLFPELAAKGDAVTLISVRTGADEVEVRRLEQGGKGAWVLPSRGDYPADVEKVRALVEALSQVKIAETKTSKPEFYDRLGVQDVDAAGSASTLVTLKAGPEVAASMIVGLAPTTRGDTPMQGPLPGVFVRKAGQAQAVLLEKNIEVPKGVVGWMKTDVLSLESSRVRSAVLVQAAEAATEAKGEAPAVAAKPEETLALVKQKAGDPNFEVETMPPGRVLRLPTAPGPIATVLSYVTIEDAGPIKTVEGLTPISTGTFKMFDGLVMQSKLYEKDGKHWLTLAASYETPVLPPSPEAQTPNDATKADAPADAKPKGKPDAKPDAEPGDPAGMKHTAEAVQKEVAELNARLSAWAFQVPEFKAKQLRTRVEELLVQPEATQGTTPGPSGDAPTPPFALPQQPGPSGPAATPPAEPAPSERKSGGGG